MSDRELKPDTFYFEQYRRLVSALSRAVRAALDGHTGAEEEGERLVEKLNRTEIGRRAVAFCYRRLERTR